MNEKYNNLKKIRKERGLTVKEVVEGAGIPMRTYQNYEYMEREIGAGTLQKLADFYGVTTDYLLGREPAPDPFADLNLNKESEEDVIDKYMSLPPNIRACLMDVCSSLLTQQSSGKTHSRKKIRRAANCPYRPPSEQSRTKSKRWLWQKAEHNAYKSLEKMSASGQHRKNH